MSDKTFLPLPTGNEGFADIRANGHYYVDKTPYLKTVFSKDIPTDGRTYVDGSSVLIFTRPRRFGKTLLMEMFESFLKINSINPGDTTIQNELFKDTKILQDQKFCDKYMGQFPVISFSLKGVHGENVNEAYLKLAELVAKIALEFDFLKDSKNLSDKEKAIFDLLCDENYLKKADDVSQSYVTSAIRDLASMLYKHFKKQVYILIDEYDVPLVKAQENGYHEKMVTLMSLFLGFFKTPPKDPISGISIISKVVMTGCLNVANRWNAAGLNNYCVKTLFDNNDIFSCMFGFTKEEVIKMLEDYGMSEYIDMVKDNYGGYRLYKDELFCPFDVVNFVADNYPKILNSKETVKADNYWSTLTSNSAVNEYIDYLTDNDTQKMQDLVDGKSISFKLNDSLYYDCLSYHNSDDFWSLLLHTGYLTKEWDKTNTKQIIDNSFDNEVRARIPNLEILRCFTDNIKNRFDKSLKQNDLADKIAHALLIGDSEFVQTQLRTYLKNFVSIRDNATKAPHENFYHGFLNGIFANCSNNFLTEYHSNIEAGDGFADIIFKDSDGEAAVVIELKVCKEKESKIKKSEESIAQIEEKNYAESLFEDEDIVSIHAVGIAFSGKSCHVSIKRLK